MAINETVNRMFAARRFNLIALALIAALIVIAYSNTFYASFHFDDNPQIVENPYIKRVTFDNIKYLLDGGRPVVSFSLMLNYSLGGLNVVGYHIFNVGCHIANSFFVYLLVLWTLNMPLLAKQYAEKARRMALFAALLFGAHPIQTESVTYIISRSELLATFFYLGAFLLFIQGARKNKFAYYIGAACSAFLSLASKEWAVTLPVVLFFYDVLFLSEGKLKPALSRWKAYVLVALSWILVYDFVTGLLFSSSGKTGGTTVGFNIDSGVSVLSPGETILTAKAYLLTSFNVIWTYIRLLFLPINQNLDYDYPIAQTLFEFPTLLSLIGHIAVVSAAFWLYKKKGWLLVPFGVAWFYVTLSPVQSFVPVKDIIFEHRLYIPSIGFFIAFVAAFEAVIDWLEKRREEKTSPVVEQA